MSEDEFEALRRFRANPPDPSSEDIAAARRALNEEIAKESAAGARVGSILGRPLRGRLQPRWRFGAAAVAGTLAVGLAAMLMTSAGDESPDQPDGRTSLAGLANQIQINRATEFEPLADRGWTLGDVAKASALVGIGRIVDVRLSYEEAPEQESVEHMFLVVKPDRLAKGEELLGSSGEVLIDEFPPQVNHLGERPGWDELREAALNSTGRVVFMLSPSPPSWYADSPNPYEGRAVDDPIFIPTHPSSLLAIEAGTDAAFPLETDENLEEVPGNIQAMESLGARVERFLGKGESLTAVSK